MRYALLLLFFGALFVSACTTTETTSSDSFTVGATFYPYYDLTRLVVGDEGEVYSVVPPTTEPHGFNPSSRDLAKLQTVDAFVSTGVEFEAFEDQLIQSLPDGVVVVHASEGITLLAADEHHHHHDEEGHDEHADDEHHDEEHHEEEHGDEDHMHEHDEHVADEHHEEHDETHVEDDHSGDGHSHGGTDPHVWLSPKNAITIVTTISEELSNAFPDKASIFAENTQRVIANLTQLEEAYHHTLAHCEKDVILVTHNAYQYLAKDYGFDVVSISGLSPESEPTPQQLAELIDEAEYHDINVVYFEELVDPKVAQAIADEVGAQTLTINPVAGSVGNKGYIEIMYDNLDKLAQGLECHD